MKRLALTLLLPASMLLIGSAQAAAVPVQSVAKLARASVLVPVEWDGFWTTVDSVYTCEGVLLFTPPASADTICGGKDFSPTAPGGITLVCTTGTVDANTIDLTCTGSGTIEPDCDASYTIVTHQTRTGDTFFSVSTINVTYTGTACPGPSDCLQVNVHGTRTGPAPTDYCATPTKRSTWGQIKVLHR